MLSQIRDYTSILLTYSIPVLAVAYCIIFLHASDQTLAFGEYLLKEKIDIPGFNATAKLYKHQKLGFEVLNIDSLDNNNFFAVTIRTTNINSNGFSNAIFKSIGDGSADYKFKDIFAKMQKYSTVNEIKKEINDEISKFYFSTKNENDFNTLLPLFLDSIYNARISEAMFRKKVYRYDAFRDEDNNITLRSNGEALIEAREKMDDIESSTEYHIFNNMFYYYTSYYGSEEYISEMNYHSFLKKYEEIYSPANTLLFHCGNFRESDVLGNISSYFSRFRHSGSVNKVRNRPDRNKNAKINVTGYYPHLADNERRVVLSWTLNDASNISDIVDMEIVSKMLIDEISNSGKTCAKSMCKSGFFHDIGTSYFTFCFDNVPVGCNITDDILDLISKVSSNGFNSIKQANVIQKYELNQSEIVESLGKDIYNRIIIPWSRGVSSLSDFISLSWEFSRVKRLIAVQARYFEMILKQKLIDNKDRIEISYANDQNYTIQRLEKRTKLADEYAKTLSKAEIENLEKLTLDNRDNEDYNNESAFPRAMLSNLSLSDNLDKENDYAKSLNFIENVTKDVVYVRFKNIIPLFSDTVENIPFFLELFGKLGAIDINDDDPNTQKIIDTSGITCKAEIFSDDSKASVAIIVEGKALSKNVNSLIDTMKVLLLRPVFNDTKLIMKIFTQKLEEFTRELRENGAKYASYLASASLSRACALREMIYGITFYKKLHLLMKEKKTDEIIKICTDVYEKLFLFGNFTVCLHCDTATKNKIEGRITIVLKKLNTHLTPEKSIDYVSIFMAECNSWKNALIKIDSDVKFVAISYSGANRMSKQSVSYDLLEYISNEINKEINSSSMTMLSSYELTSKCDHNVTQCVSNMSNIFQNLSQRIKLFKDDGEEMIKAKLEYYRKWNAHHILPKETGYYAFVFGITEKQENQRLRMALNIKKSDLENACLKLMEFNNVKTVVVGSEKDCQIYDFTSIVD